MKGKVYILESINSEGVSAEEGEFRTFAKLNERLSNLIYSDEMSYRVWEKRVVIGKFKRCDPKDEEDHEVFN